MTKLSIFTVSRGDRIFMFGDTAPDVSNRRLYITTYTMISDHNEGFSGFYLTEYLNFRLIACTFYDPRNPRVVSIVSEQYKLHYLLGGNCMP